VVFAISFFCTFNAGMGKAIPAYDPMVDFPALGQGSEKAFRSIFERFKRPFYGASLKLVRSEDVAEEIVQQCFVALWEKRGKVAAAANPESYLLTMLHNLIYAHFRGLAKEMALRNALADFDAEPELPEVVRRDEDKLVFLNTLIEKLPEQQRRVYLLSKREGLSRNEVAERLHLSPNTVRNHLAEAIRFITEHYPGATSALIWAAIWRQL